MQTRKNTTLSHEAGKAREATLTHAAVQKHGLLEAPAVDRLLLLGLKVEVRMGSPIRARRRPPVSRHTAKECRLLM